MSAAILENSENIVVQNESTVSKTEDKAARRAERAARHQRKQALKDQRKTMRKWEMEQEKLEKEKEKEKENKKQAVKEKQMDEKKDEESVGEGAADEVAKNGNTLDDKESGVKGNDTTAASAAEPKKTKRKRETAKPKKTKKAKGDDEKQETGNDEGKSVTEPLEPAEDKSVGDLALVYVRQFANDRSNWKFQKLRQAWLLRYWHDPTKFVEDDFKAFVKYIADMKGHAREQTLANAKAIVEEKKEKRSKQDVDATEKKQDVPNDDAKKDAQVGEAKKSENTYTDDERKLRRKRAKKVVKTLSEST